MQEENTNNNPEVNVGEDFGLTQDEQKNYKVKNFFAHIGYFFQKIEPVIVKILNSIVYYSLKLIKSTAISIFQMIKGGGQ